MPAHHLHALEYSTSIFAVGKVQFGYIRHLRGEEGTGTGYRRTVALSLLSPELASRYSGRTAPSFGVFSACRLRDTRCKRGSESDSAEEFHVACL